jgi:hypothetical protein
MTKLMTREMHSNIKMLLGELDAAKRAANELTGRTHFDVFSHGSRLSERFLKVAIQAIEGEIKVLDQEIRDLGVEP